MLHMKFLSPFINMFVRDADYLALLQDFHRRIRQTLVYAGSSDDEVSRLHYPIFSLGGTHLHMNHDADENRAAAVKKWGERLQRLNEDNLFFVIAKIVVFLTTQPVCPFFDANVGHAIEEVTFMQS